METNSKTAKPAPAAHLRTHKGDPMISIILLMVGAVLGAVEAQLAGAAT